MKLFDIIVNEDDLTGMSFISLVEDPAVCIDFLKFSKDKEYEVLKFDSSKRLISGVVCLADTPIYRWNKKLGDYYVRFSRETIEKMMLKYSKMGLNNSVDLQHNEKAVDGVIMVESYIFNRERGIAPVEFSDVPDGSWICTFKVENDAIWNEIKENNSLRGFSLAGMFELEKVEEKDEIEEIIDEILK